MLLLFFLLFPFIFASKDCTRNGPRKEGFLKVSKCIAGYYPGSCLLILPQQSLHDAYESCHFDYGGRLATAQTIEAFTFWGNTIHFDQKVKVDSGTRFWIGYDKNGFKKGYLTRPSEMIYIEFWKNILHINNFYEMQEKDWEKGADKALLELFDCKPRNAAAFNPNTRKIDIIPSGEEDKNFAFCEIPRKATVECENGWNLIQQSQLCVNVQEQNMTFSDALKSCQANASTIVTAKDEIELKLLRNIINAYKLRNALNGIGGFWAGLKSDGKTSFSLDGTVSTVIIQENNNITTTDKFCCAYTYHSFEVVKNATINLYGDMDGICVDCNEKLPFMCQKTAQIV